MAVFLMQLGNDMGGPLEFLRFLVCFSGKVIRAPFSDCGFYRCRYAGKTLFQQADSLEAAVFCQYGGDGR